MTEYLFPDNTVLCNFAAVGRVSLLESVLRGRGRWTTAVAFEAERSARAIPALGELVRGRCLGDPIEITVEKEVQRVNRVRRVVFGGMDDEPLRHLGEAETCHVLLNWTEFAGSWWISDDAEALRYARHQGITTRETVDLLASAVADGDLDADAAFVLLQTMANEGRSLRLPASAEELRR